MCAPCLFLSAFCMADVEYCCARMSVSVCVCCVIGPDGILRAPGVDIALRFCARKRWILHDICTIFARYLHELCFGFKPL